MFRNLSQRNTSGQNTAEYALLIALVVAGVIAMQTYTQRSLQAKMRDASQYMTTSDATAMPGITATDQYEPYYQKSDYQVTHNSEENKRQAAGLIAQDSTSNRTRAAEGYQQSDYGSGEQAGH